MSALLIQNLTDGDVFVPYNRGLFSKQFYVKTGYFFDQISAKCPEGLFWNFDQGTKVMLLSKNPNATQITSELIRQINQHFIIRIRNNNFVKDKSLNELKGAGQYASYLGDERLAFKHFQKALSFLGKDCTFQLTRGLRIDFVGK